MECTLSTAYLGSIQYYCKLYSFDTVWIDGMESYQKQTYRNRCYISTTSGPLALTVPIVKPESERTLTRDIMISDHGAWRHQHWIALDSAYRNSPFFEYYMDDFHPFYERKYKYLLDFNERLRELICSLLSFSPDVRLTDRYESSPENDFRQAISPRTGYGWDEDFAPRSYYQVFLPKLGFMPNMSIVDLLFNMGPEGLIVLRDSAGRNN